MYIIIYCTSGSLYPLLAKGLSFIPRTPERDAKEFSRDLGEFIKTTCGKILVKSQREQLKKNKKSKHTKGTPRLTPHHSDEYCQRKQTNWLSNRLMSSQMEILFMQWEVNWPHWGHTGRHWYSINHPHNLARKEHHALQKFNKTSSLVFKKDDKTTCTVVKTRKDYIKEGMIYLSDTRTYKKLDRDYTPDAVQHLKYTLEQCRKGGLLSDHMVCQNHTVT